MILHPFLRLYSHDASRTFKFQYSYHSAFALAYLAMPSIGSPFVALPLYDAVACHVKPILALLEILHIHSPFTFTKVQCAVSLIMVITRLPFAFAYLDQESHAIASRQPNRYKGSSLNSFASSPQLPTIGVVPFPICDCRDTVVTPRTT
jgi:hypothetical protein